MRRRPGAAATAARRQTALLLSVLAGMATGCQPGIGWRWGGFEDLRAQAQKEGKLTFVYFIAWYSVECTHFEERILSQPEVLEATADMVCVKLNFDWDRQLAEDWGLDRVPAFAILDQTGSVLESAAGEITLEDLLAAIGRAKNPLPPIPPADPPP